MSTPLDELNFPAVCRCGEGPFANADEVDEHITEEHLPEAVWDYALENIIAEEPKHEH